MLSLLLSPKFWFVLLLAASNAFSYYKGHHAGYAEGTSEVQGLFDAYKTKSIEDAMAEQVRRNAIEDQLKLTNKEVTANYVSLQAATNTAVLAVDADRLRALASLRAARDSAVPTDTATGLPTDATAEDRVLGECFQRYEAVAGDAEHLANQVTALVAYVLQVQDKE